MGAIHDAISEYDIITVKQLLNRGYPIEEKDAEGNTPLLVAIMNDMSDLVTTLLERGADTDAQNNDGDTGMDLVLNHGVLEMCYFVSKIDVKFRVKEGYNSFLMSIFNGKFKEVKSYIETYDQINKTNLIGRTPLMWAAERGYQKIVKLLLDAGASVNVQENQSLDSALHFGVESGNAGTVIELLEHGANVNARNSYGQTPLISAAISAAMYPYATKIVQALIDYGADVSAENTQDQTPLSNAAWIGSKEVLKLLLDAGAVKEPEDLISAIWLTYLDNGQNKTLMLLEAGVPIGLQEAVRLEDMEAVQRLIKQGADVNDCYHYNTLPIKLAALDIRRYRAPLMRVLYDAGADLRKLSVSDREWIIRWYEYDEDVNAIVEALRGISGDAPEAT